MTGYPTAYRSRFAREFAEQQSGFQKTGVSVPTNTALVLSYPIANGSVTGFIGANGQVISRNVRGPRGAITINGEYTVLDPGTRRQLTRIGVAVANAATHVVPQIRAARVGVAVARAVGRRAMTEAERIAWRRRWFRRRKDRKGGEEELAEIIRWVLEEEVTVEDPNTYALPSGWEVARTCNSGPETHVSGYQNRCWSSANVYQIYDSATAAARSTLTLLRKTANHSATHIWAVQTREIRRVSGSEPFTFQRATTTTTVETPTYFFPSTTTSYRDDPRSESGQPTAEPPAPPHGRRPPPPGTKERKGGSSSQSLDSILNRILYAGSKTMHWLSEASDLVEVFYEALPDKIQKQCKSEFRFSEDSRGGALMKGRCVAAYYKELDVNKVITGYIYNHYEDKLIGGLNAGAQGNSPRLTDTDGIMRGRGLTFGPAF